MSSPRTLLVDVAISGKAIVSRQEIFHAISYASQKERDLDHGAATGQVLVGSMLL